MLSDFLILMRAELLVTLTIFLLLFIKLGRGISNTTVLNILHVVLFASCIIGFFGRQDGELFAGMFVSTPLLFFQKSLLSVAVLLIALLNYDWLKKHAHLSEFFLLLLSAQLGLQLLLSAGNLLIFYLALELSTIPVAALANFDTEKKRSAEAAMKMILSSAFSSGVMLFGISLIYGAGGSIQFGEIAGVFGGTAPLEITGFIMFFAGVAFKLSVVPFHLWTADVYEGSPVAVTSFLSVVSKGAMSFVLYSILYKTFYSLSAVIYPLLIILSLATLIIGNLFAIRQNNLKRFLAFSSIAQVGFILAALSSGTVEAAAAITYFVLIYIFTNLAAFGVISIVSTATGMESIGAYKGFYQNNKLLTWAMAIALFSLAGVPPTAGFFGKLFLVMAAASKLNTWFIAVLALNLVLSLYYYLRLVRAMFMEKNENPIQKIDMAPMPKLALLFCVLAMVALGLIGNVYEFIKSLF